jgi:hypothetical protein
VDVESIALAALPEFDALVEASRDSILLVPAGIEAPSDERPVFASSVPTVLKLARAEGVPMTIYGAPESPRLLEKRSSERPEPRSGQPEGAEPGERVPDSDAEEDRAA